MTEERRLGERICLLHFCLPECHLNYCQEIDESQRGVNA